MNGYDVQRWEHVKRLAEPLNMEVEAVGAHIRLADKDSKRIYGMFESVDTTLCFIHGFDTGFSLGRCECLQELEQEEALNA